MDDLPSGTDLRPPPSDADILRRMAEVLLQSGLVQFAEKLQREFAAFKRSDYGILENFHYNQGEDVVGDGSELRNRRIAGLDIVKGLDRFDGDEETYLRLLRSYLNSIRSIIDFVGVVSEAGLADYTLAVHSIKGTSLDIFAEAVGNEAAELEKAAKSRDFDFLNERNPAFHVAVLQLLGDIEDLLSSVNSGNTKPVKAKPEGAMLSKLLAACLSYDMDGADRAMAEIDKYQYESNQEFVDGLRKNVDTADFEEIIEKLSDTN